MYILAGASVGLAVGLTGVGGGSLMTPLLLAFGFPLHIAVGTDLMYAAITKAGGVYVHTSQKSVRWDLVGLLAAGSLPAAVLTILALRFLFDDPSGYAPVITTTLGAMLILTSLVLIFRTRIQEMAAGIGTLTGNHVSLLTFLMGVSLGVLVTLSSVGAAAIATAIVMLLYPRLSGLNVVGTNLAHAVPLTLIAGLGHFALGNVDLLLLVCLLAGSLPATWFGSRLAGFIPDRVMKPVLATTLFGVGIKFAFF